MKFGASVTNFLLDSTGNIQQEVRLVAARGKIKPPTTVSSQSSCMVATEELWLSWLTTSPQIDIHTYIHACMMHIYD
jgi:hypothetical protein